jgi:SNF2 family DNA or RNA helicase
MTVAQRAKALQHFRTPDGPDVMIISHVGGTGINLDFANVLIVLVRNSSYKWYYLI